MRTVVVLNPLNGACSAAATVDEALGMFQAYAMKEQDISV